MEIALIYDAECNLCQTTEDNLSHEDLACILDNVTAVGKSGKEKKIELQMLNRTGRALFSPLYTNAGNRLYGVGVYIELHQENRNPVAN